jgi:hypothetical protein
LRKAKRANPRFIACHRILAPALALAGDEAAACEVGQELRRLDPSFRVSSFLAWYPLQRPDDVKRLEAGLRAAGLPD